MATIRFQALAELFQRKPVEVKDSSVQVSDYYGTDVFDKPKMKKFLSEEAYKNVIKAIESGSRIDLEMANQIAAGMKQWAVSKGVTHYTHWFHPLTDTTAEKHDSFFQVDNEGMSFETFDGRNLVQQEPDASSFPSGGIRNTFEARGYTAWDPSSPAFIIGSTLCIPTIFISYTGEALDYKMPLLRSLKALDRAATDVCRLFDQNVNKVIATLGWEQEYFLIDEALYLARPDIALTGRSLMGHSSAKDQQLEDHYFGAIPERVLNFMADLEVTAHKLGIPVRTRHNEVAPNQFECAPMFEETNLAVDHNMLLMDIMDKVARKHGFRVLLHEKPFAGINGSGKHNNWSMATNTGVNLLSPGKDEAGNLRFLTFLINTVKAVHDNAELFRASILSAGNEHRLGANEAPPSIISVFLGAHLTRILHILEEKVTDEVLDAATKQSLKFDLEKIPEILLDNTDRNRTSPFAFTGNRFEFRAVGSSANCASPMIAVNTAVAGQLVQFSADIKELLNQGISRDEAILKVLHTYIKQAKSVLFEGNNYSQEWREEAARRGLTNIGNVPEAIQAFISEKSVKLFQATNVLSHRELEARVEIYAEHYTKKIQIESRVLGDLAINHIVPTAIKYQTELITNVSGLKQILTAAEFDEYAGARIELIKTISKYISEIKKQTNDMIEERKIANNVEDTMEKAKIYNTKVKPYLTSIRYFIDKLELIIDNEIWPLPKYRELLFNR